jgi:ABC-2 type transport system ATP-binding protein
LHAALSDTAPRPNSAAAPMMIRAEGLVKHYGSVHAVDGVSFQVHRGEIVGFLGPNGAGKSTTMKMLTGYLYPDMGEVAIAGTSFEDDAIAARSRIGYLPEHTPLYGEMRVRAYLRFVGDVRGLPRAKCLEGIERVIAACDLEGYVGRRIRTLSKGYRQRVGLAQALLSDPDVLILDEPTSGLDPAEIVRIRDLIVDLSRTKTILLSTHVLPEVEEVCRRAIIIAAGTLVADGTLLELSEGEGENLAVVLGADENEAKSALEALEGVNDVALSGRGAEGRVRFHLGVEERFAVSERVSALASERGWPLYELRHEVPTLETVFLRRTRGLAALASDAS